MRIEERIDGDVLVLEVKERRVDARSASDLKEKIGGSVGRGFDRIVLDLEEVEFVDSSGMGAIVSGLKLLASSSNLVISGASTPVRELFKVTRMDQVFRMFPTIAEAQKALAGRG
jgi:anti-sigma B factor antagonist